MRGGKKFLPPPRHALDIHSHRAVVKAINALKNGKITDKNGNVIGIIHYADGNTVWQLSSSGGGKFWMYEDHREGDPTFPYAADTFMFLSDNNPLVTTGMIDLVSGLRAFSKPGFWQVGSNNVPAQVVVSGVTKWNVPVYPYPGATGTPTGSPLKGDLDLGQFWIYHGQLVC